MPDQDGRKRSLSDYRGRKVVLYFYPRDNTPGCTREALSFKAAFDALTDRGVEVIGLSRDGQPSHLHFREKYALPFTLLSDTELTVLRAYEAWQLKKLYGRESYGVVRSTYLIDENGVIEKVYEKAKPDLNASEILQYLDGKA